MGRKSFGIDNIYNKEEIFNILDKLKITQDGQNIITKYDTKLISNAVVSEQYELFDFSNFAKDVINEVENYFTPEKYKLRITKGQQELRLIGEEVLINDDVFSKMFNIVNSTDKSRALSINVGLMRLVCSNGMVVKVDDEYEQVRVKHYKNKLPNKVLNFVENISNFDITINKQTDILENISGKIISFKDIAKKLLINKDGIITNHASNRIRVFSKNIQNSKSDSIKNLTSEQIFTLNNIQKCVLDQTFYELVDINMDAYVALNLYTETYNKLDSTILKRETNRFLDLIK